MCAYMLCKPCLNHVYLRLGDNGHSSYNLSLIGNLFLGSDDIWQRLVVLCILLAIGRFWHLRKKNNTYTQVRLD